MSDTKVQEHKHIWALIWPKIRAGSILVQCEICGKVGYKLYGQRK